MLVAGGVTLIMRSLSDNIVFFYKPSELTNLDLSREIRLGGLVETGSIVKLDDATLEFDLTDNKAKMRVRYRGVIPMLFREGQGVVAQGALKNGVFVARELLTKHDENYKPPL
jgi:cytochrome c-type biogenesis protein CcmE